MARQQLDIQQSDALAIYHPHRWWLRFWPIVLMALVFLWWALFMPAFQSLFEPHELAEVRENAERVRNSDMGRIFRPLQIIFFLIQMVLLVLLIIHSMRASNRDPSLVLLKDGFIPRPVDHPYALVEWSDVKQIKDHGSWPVRYFVVSFKEPKRLGEIGLRMSWPLGFLPMRFVIFTGLHLSKDARHVAEEMRQLMQEAA